MELWDIYDSDGALTGRTHPRGQPLAPGDYHLAVTVTVVDSRGRVLLTRRSREKTLCPRVWECPGGGVLAGETSREGAARELLEETGLVAEPGDAEFLHVAHRIKESTYYDFYFEIRTWTGEPSIREPEKCSGMAWFPVDDLPQDMIPNRRRTFMFLRTGMRYSEIVYQTPEEEEFL